LPKRTHQHPWKDAVPYPRTRRDRSPFDSYLAEINQAPLLGAEEEHELACRIAQGDAAARDSLIRANLRLVVAVARAHAGKGLALEDLIAEGNLGLVRAAEGFDATAGTRFSTYATYWVKQSIRSALRRDGNTVRLPHHMCNLLTKWHQAANALRRELGRAPAEEEVAARLGLSDKRLRAVRKALRVRASGQLPDDPDGSAALDLIADGGATGPEDEVTEADQMGTAMDSLTSLSDRESTILRLRFGLDGAEPATLQQVGEQFGCTRERVRQIERDALAKLRQQMTA
jgi:RNA polymerase primary sigma factor